ncbi:MAG: hypothetical protein IPN40_17225 [Uliginosibacterium sp.]|nr:hypothetical protein [Uliginosibacterium sp.]
MMEKMGVSSLAELVQHAMISTPKEAFQRLAQLDAR